MKITRLIISAFLCFFSLIGGYAQTDDAGLFDNLPEDFEVKEYYTQYDSIGAETRTFDEATLAGLREDPALQYGSTQLSMTLWDAFVFWLKQLFEKLFSPLEGGNGKWVDYLLYVIAIGILIYVLMRLLKLSTFDILSGKPQKRKLSYEVIEDNIHEMDFEKLLQDAQAAKNYRLAIRLYYLYGLKLLSDKHHIYWEPGKTNHDYLNELNTPDLKPDFRSLNYYFEYAWYGDFVVTDDMFGQVSNLFTNWKSRI